MKGIKERERGSALLVVMVFTIVFLILLGILFGEFMINLKAYARIRNKFLSQMIVSDVISITRYEEARELTDFDNDLSFIYDVWEKDGKEGTFQVYKYQQSLADDDNFLKYYPYPDFSGISDIAVDKVNVPEGIFAVSAVNLGQADIPYAHQVNIIAVVPSFGYTMSDIYADLTNNPLVADEKYRDSVSDVAFNIIWNAGAEDVVMATGNAKEWGEQIRVRGTVWEKQAPDVEAVNFKPVRTALNSWEVYAPGKGNPFAEAPSDEKYHENLPGDHVMDSVISGFYHYGGQYFTVDGIPFGQGDCDSSNLTVGENVCNLSTGFDKPIDIFSGGKYRRLTAISYTKEVVSNDESDDKFVSYSDDRINSYPWYRFISDALWYSGADSYSDIIDIYYWEYHKVNPQQMSPTEALTGGNLTSTYKEFYTDILMDGYKPNDSTLFDVFFGKDWDDLVGRVSTSAKLTPIERARKNNDRIDLSGNGSYVITLYTKNEDGELHTILRYAPGSCEYKHGCELTGDSNDIDLQANSSTGKGILVDFGDNADLYLVTPCQPGYDTWLPIWDDLCHIAYSPSVVSVSGYTSYLFIDSVGREFRKIDIPTSYLSNYPDYFLLYPDDSINPLVSDTSYNPNWQYEWTRFVPITEKGFENYFSSYSKNGVDAKIYHPNWKNMIQYNFNITILGKDLRVMGDVIPVPDKSTQYEIDLAKTPKLDSDIPNLTKTIEGERLGFLLKGYQDASVESGSGGYVLWFWDKIGYMQYLDENSIPNDEKVYFNYYDEDGYIVGGDYFISLSQWESIKAQNQYYDYISKGNKYGFRFAKDPDIYLGKDIKNRDMYHDDSQDQNPYKWEDSSWDKLFYADAFVKNGGVGMVYKENYSDDTTDPDSSVWDNEKYKYPINSETFRLLGSFLMDGGRDVEIPVSYRIILHYYDASYHIHIRTLTYTTMDPHEGFSSPVYYLPTNALTNRLMYWLIIDDPRMVNIKLYDVRMKR